MSGFCRAHLFSFFSYFMDTKRIVQDTKMEYDQKIENLLNLSLSVPESERMQSEELSAGFDEQEDLWTLILKYNGDIEAVREIAASVVPLFGGYAVVRIHTEAIPVLAELSQVEYIEKPKMLYFENDMNIREER